MNRNHSDTKNEIKFGSMMTLLLIGSYLGVAATFYVGLKHELYAKGEDKKELERELESLRNENDVAIAQIAKITSRAALQRDLESGLIALAPISEDSIRRIGPDTTPQTDPMDDLVPVVHQVVRN